jgi:hypothetical protein
LRPSEASRVETGSQPEAISTAAKFKQTRIWAWARNSWLGEWWRAFRRCPHEAWAWANLEKVSYPDVAQLAKSIAVLDARAAHPLDAKKEEEAPIFLLSTGWRAGSTLLQRVLVTDPRLLLWGEPLGEMTIVSRIAEMISPSISERNLQLWKDQLDPSSPELSTSWVANLYPPSDDFRSGLQALFDQWLREPARERGFARWGMKDVRLSATDATLLQWLYPNAKFVIITRHPYDSYRSLADAGWGEVYDRYPDVNVDSAASFGSHWNRLAISWSQLPAGFPAVHIKYEDLIAGKVNFRELESWLGIQIKEGKALSVAVGGTAKRARLAWFERIIIAHEAAEGMRAMGYSE